MPINAKYIIHHFTPFLCCKMTCSILQGKTNQMTHLSRFLSLSYLVCLTLYNKVIIKKLLHLHIFFLDSNQFHVAECLTTIQIERCKTYIYRLCLDEQQQFQLDFLCRRTSNAVEYSSLKTIFHTSGKHIEHGSFCGLSAFSLSPSSLLHNNCKPESQQNATPSCVCHDRPET